MNNGRVYEIVIEDNGEAETDYLYKDGGNATALLKFTWDTYRSNVDLMGLNPFSSINDLALLCNTLIKLVERADITPTSSPLMPCLHNAVNFKDREASLPFIRISEKNLNLVSIIEVP